MVCRVVFPPLTGALDPYSLKVVGKMLYTPQFADHWAVKNVFVSNDYHLRVKVIDLFNFRQLI